MSAQTLPQQHIQRLMVMGNFALLAGLDPAAVHRWYVGVYIDAFEWVELPNTVGKRRCWSLSPASPVPANPRRLATRQTRLRRTPAAPQPHRPPAFSRPCR